MERELEGVYTTGASFRASAEAYARNYRLTRLHLTDFNKFGHKLTDKDAEQGMNFLPSLRNEILSAVHQRNAKGKGVDIERTTQNMLSSQAMSFNLFVPLNSNKKYSTAFFNQLLGDCRAITNDVEIEYTPSNAIFNDQSGKGGVDCDALLQYTNDNVRDSLLVIETKYVETEFSVCGFRKNEYSMQKKKRDLCPIDTIVNSDFSNCRYHYKKHYHYWKVAEDSNLFKMDLIHNDVCPFGGSLWQLWVNMTLAYGIAKERGCNAFNYAVICHERNDKLSDNGKVFLEFKKLLRNPYHLKIIYLSEIRQSFEFLENDYPDIMWTKEFMERYCI